MKRAAAFILSLTVIWIQVMASAQTLSAAAPIECGCCTGEKNCCCVEPATPDAKPLPAVPVPTSLTIDFTAVIPRRVAWTLPASGPAIVSSPDSFPSSLAVPLFTRHCARLI